MNILCIGDIVGKPGRNFINERLPKLIKEHKIDFVIANGENCAHGVLHAVHMMSLYMPA